MLAMGFTTSSNANILEGLGIGFSVGQAGYYAVGEEKTDNQKSGEDFAKGSGAFGDDWGSVFLEYTVGPITLGVDYHISQINTPENTNAQWTSDSDKTALTNTVKATFEDHTTAYIMIPVWKALYVKAGAIHVEIITGESLGTGGEYGNTDTTGLTGGFGFQHEIQDGFSIRAEAMYAEYDSVTATNSNNTSTSITVTDMMGARGTVSLVKTF